MNSNPYERRDVLDKAPEGEKPARSFTLLELLVVIAVIAVLLAILLPNVRYSRGAAQRAQCAGHLKKIAVALYEYEAEHHALPPAYTVDVEGKPLHSWRTLLLPYLEQRALYEKIDLNKPWDDPVNRQALQTGVDTYECPAANLPAGHTTYLAVTAAVL